MEDILNYLFAHLNGPTETALIFILVFLDTFLGGKWRKKRKVALTSGGGLGGLKTSIPLALMPVTIWAFTVLMSLAPHRIGNREFDFYPLLFDIISFIVTMIISSYLLKSILANMQLSGIDIPSFLSKWVADEFHVKIEKIKEEPESAEKRNENVE